jgi:hypothetical protein
MGIFYMRRTIETVPRDGSVVIVEDDASVTYDLAHWSPEAGQWVGEDGEPSKITPTHWHPLPGENYLQQGHEVSTSPSQAGPSASRARRYSFFPFSAGRAASAAASNVTAPRSVETAAPATVEAFEAQTAPVEAKRARRFAVFSIAATFVAAALIGTYFRAEIAAYVTPYPDRDRQVVGQETQLPSQDSRKTDLSALRHAKAQAGGIQEAKDRFDALSR